VPIGRRSADRSAGDISCPAHDAPAPPMGRFFQEAVSMMDILSLGLTVVFFALSVGLIALCDRL